MSDDEIRARARRPDQHGLPGPDDLLQPGPDHWTADHRAARDPPGHVRRTRPTSVRPSCWTWSGIPKAKDRLNDYPHQFSGGMRQRAMIAMALTCKPQILIADEPTTALDVTIQAQIVDLVKHLRDELGMAIIWITHDLGIIAGLAQRVIVMYGGLLYRRSPGQGAVRQSAASLHHWPVRQPAAPGPGPAQGPGFHRWAAPGSVRKSRTTVRLPRAANSSSRRCRHENPPLLRRSTRITGWPAGWTQRPGERAE